VLPQLLEESGLTPQQFVIQDPNLWQRMVRPLGYDAGIRTLQRTLQGAVRKAAREIVEKQVPQVVITEQNINQFLPQY
jgi:ATP-dependent Lon protease